jgi:hypothetical protein
MPVRLSLWEKPSSAGIGVAGEVRTPDTGEGG